MTTPPLQSPSWLVVHLTSEIAWSYLLCGFPWLCAAYVYWGACSSYKTIPPFHTLVLTNVVRRCLITTTQLSWECNSANRGLISDEASKG